MEADTTIIYIKMLFNIYQNIFASIVDPYFGQLYYQSIGVNKWLARFIVAKSVDILYKV